MGELSLEELARETRDFFERDMGRSGLPCTRRFPNGSCEIAVIVLGSVFKTAIHPSEILVVDASHPDHGLGRHFWIEAGDLVFDLTADQFDGIEAPIIGGLSPAMPYSGVKASRDRYSAWEKSREWRDWGRLLEPLEDITIQIAGRAIYAQKGAYPEE